MPAISKRPEDRIRRNKPTPADSIAVIHADAAVPAPPAEISEAAKAEWASLWASPLAKTYDIRSDVAALRRLFKLRHKLAVYEQLPLDEEVVTGSTGQMVMHPLVKQADSLRSQIVQLEDRFGLSPIARLKLGVTLGDATRSLEDLNNRLLAEESDDDDDDDPRLRSVIS